MQKILLVLMTISSCMLTAAQEKVDISRGTTLSVSDNAYIILEDVDLNNHGTLNTLPGAGSFLFTGTKNSRITGKGNFLFNKMVIDKKNNTTVITETNLHISGELQFVNGLLNIGDQVINLGSTGTLKGEKENAHALTSGSGYIERMLYLDRPSLVNPGNLGLVISSPVNMGNTIIRRGHLPQQDMSSGATSIARYYDVIAQNNNELHAVLGFTYLDSELGENEETKTALLNSEDRTRWNSIGFDRRNLSDNYAEKSGIRKLSRITIATARPSAWETAVTTGNAYPRTVVWPNPATDRLMVNVYAKQTGPCRLSLFDASGRLVNVMERNLSNGINTITWSLKELPQGNYSLQISRGKNMETIKLEKF